MGGTLSDVSSMGTQMTPCDECDKKFETVWAYKEHLENGHKMETQQPVVQNGLAKRFGSRPAALDKHRKEKHTNRVDEFAYVRATSKPISPSQSKLSLRPVCSVCGRDYATLKELHDHQLDTALKKRDGTHIWLAKEPGSPTCEVCGKQFDTHDSLEQHFISSHAVIFMRNDDNDRIEQETKFLTQWAKPDQGDIKIQSVHKIYTSAWRAARYEKYKGEIEARGQSKGNELLLYHGTTLACDLGSDRQRAKICNNSKDRRCSMCSILLGGFQPSKAPSNKWQRYGSGIYTTPYSGKSDDYIPSGATRRAVFVCKVLTGRQFETERNLPELKAPPRGYDSVWGKPGAFLNYDEYVVYSTRAILPAYIIVYERTKRMKKEPPKVPVANPKVNSRFIRKGSTYTPVGSSVQLLPRTSGGPDRSRATTTRSPASSASL